MGRLVSLVVNLVDMVNNCDWVLFGDYWFWFLLLVVVMWVVVLEVDVGVEY